jgi:soluble lytic murein transglycosylase-like protein
MPGTATYINKKYDIPYQTSSYKWQIIALLKYNKEIYKLLDKYKLNSVCDVWMATLAGYNGGPGHTVREIIIARPNNVWFGGIENVKLPNRSVSNQKQNKEYPRRIYNSQKIFRLKYNFPEIKCKGE